MQEKGSGHQKVSPLVVVKTVLAAFLGIRKRTGHEEAEVRLTPVQLILTGVVLAAAFVVSLIVLVRFIISQAGS